MFTIEEGRPWHDKIPGLHCKNLFIKDRKGGIWLVVMPGDKRADLGRLEKTVGAPRFSFARPEVLHEVLQLTPGSVPPHPRRGNARQRVGQLPSAAQCRLDDAALRRSGAIRARARL